MKNKITNFVLNTLHKKIQSIFRTNEEGRIIRKTRMKKFKPKGKKLVLAIQFVAVWYLLILTGSYLTTDTGAYFNDVEVIEEKLGAADDFDRNEVGEEWDRSSLSFSNFGGFCSKDYPGIIFSEIVNGGDQDMAGTTKYYLYRVDIGEDGPNKNNLGELIASGDVPILQGENSSQNKAILTFKPNLNEIKPGKYKFKADQRPNHGNPNNDPNKEKDHETWGPEITVTENDINNCKGVVGAEPNPNADPNPVPNPDLDTVPPNEVINPSGKQLNKDKIKFSWSNPNDSDFSHVNIYRDGELLKKLDQKETIYFDESFTPLTEHTYLITTIDLIGNKSKGSTIKITTE